MNAIHINWTKPFTNKTNKPYETEDFEILTTVLSALKWRDKNGSIKMVTDSIGLEYYKNIGLSRIWNDIECSLDNIDVNADVYWAAGKIFALKKQNAPIAMIDTDFIVWDSIDFDSLCDLTVIHFEDLYPDVYPPKEHFNVDNYSFDTRFDWTIPACNTAFCVIKNNEFLKYYTEKSIEFMHSTKETSDRLTYMVFAEQRLINMCAKVMGINAQSFSDLYNLFSEENNMFTHTWGMKQQMRDNDRLRYDFCRRCINRIIHEYTFMYDILKNIDCLKRYF